jgi:hypothetical protein
MLYITSDRRKLLPCVMFMINNAKRKIPSGIYIRVQERGWMSELMKDWFHVVWGRCPGHLLHHRSLHELDSFVVILLTIYQNKWAI